MRRLEYLQPLKLSEDQVPWVRNFQHKKTGLDPEEGEVKIGERNINNVRYVDDIILLTESSNDLKQPMKVKKESAKARVHLNIKKAKIIAA